MLSLRDFYHLPEVDSIFDILVHESPGLTLVTGLEQRAIKDPARFLSSGRKGIFRILVRQILEANPAIQATVVAESRDAFRVQRSLHRRMHFELAESPEISSARIKAIAPLNPGLLIVNKLFPENAASALEAVDIGVRVITQMDTIFRGADVLRELQGWGISANHIKGLIWVVALQRVPMLCECKSPILPRTGLIQSIQHRYPHLKINPERTYFTAGGCEICEHTGRRQEITAFDFYRHNPEAGNHQPNLLPLESYLLRLAESGYIPLDDLIRIESDHIHHAYQLLSSSEQALSETKTTLERKIVELEAANRVLRNRTKELVSLQEIGQALIGTATLRELARLVCRQASLICGADRAVFYYLRDEDSADVLATHGWAPGRVPQRVKAQLVCDPISEPTPSTFNAWPPGVNPRHPDVEGQKLVAGLRFPLIAQGQKVGAMIVHATTKNSFKPGAVTLLQTLANQAAIAIQRAGLIENLHEKIEQLEAAQEDLAQKERMERELELAREVQQAVLPSTFPHIPGYCFAARNQPARQVGGDFYDVIKLGPDRFGVVIADVSDKGMPAAVYMALTRSVMVAEARRENSPAAVLQNVNELLRELGRARMFVTVFYGIIDILSHQMTYARAGHDRPLLLRGSDVIELRGDGVFLGYLDTQDFFLTEESIRLQPGDRLILYTDGLTDTISPSGRRFDLSGFRNLMKDGIRCTATDLCDTVFDRLAEYRQGAEQYDDMTLLVVALDPPGHRIIGVTEGISSQEE